MMIGTAFSIVNPPAATIPTTSYEVVEELFTGVRGTMPTNRPTIGNTSSLP